MKRVLLAVVGCVLALAGCTSSGEPGPTGGTTRTMTSTVTSTRAVPGADFTPPPATNVKSRPKSGKAPSGETKGSCPYVRGGLDEDPTSKPNVADIVGSRVGFTTRLTTLTPVGCRFYFAYDNHAIADIQPRSFASAALARAAMIKTAEAGRRARSYPGFVKGVDGINYQTKFYSRDDGKDWAFAFATGMVMVVVHTDQTDSPLNALYLAKAIVAKF